MSSGYPIAFVERNTGISRETLRMWERRYGFPLPDRDGAGDRSYSPADLDRLRLIKRLLDQGYRPGKVVPMSDGGLSGLANEPALPVEMEPGAWKDFLNLMKSPGLEAARDWLRGRLSRATLATFLLETLAPLTEAVGDAWATGHLRVHDEHLYTEMVTRLLRQAMEELPRGDEPPILLATLSGERHGLGLLMAEAMFHQAGARCLNLGVDVPIPEIVLAVRHHRASALALSFSVAYPRRRIAPQIDALREQLPPDCRIWAGGRMTARLRIRPGVRYCPELVDAPGLLAELKVSERPGEMG